MHRLGLIIADHFQMLALSTLTVFEFANLVTESPFYQPEVYSEHGGTVRSSSGIGVDSAKIERGNAGGYLAGGGRIIASG